MSLTFPVPLSSLVIGGSPAVSKHTIIIIYRHACYTLTTADLNMHLPILPVFEPLMTFLQLLPSLVSLSPLLLVSADNRHNLYWTCTQQGVFNTLTFSSIALLSISAFSSGVGP